MKKFAISYLAHLSLMTTTRAEYDTKAIWQKNRVGNTRV
jgi:hypothetical protein